VTWLRTAMLEEEHIDEKTNYQFSSKLDAEQDFGVKVCCNASQFMYKLYFSTNFILL
jgi:hypothetical protein